MSRKSVSSSRSLSFGESLPDFAAAVSAGATVFLDTFVVVDLTRVVCGACVVVVGLCVVVVVVGL